MGKKINGETYYYLRTMARVGGKPKMVGERYLGKAADIEAAMAGATSVPERSRHLGFGDVAATWSMIERLGVAEIVDEVVGARRADAGASVGTYVALTVLNRVCAPRSKLAFASWWATVAGDQLVRLPAAATDHRRFWDAMDAISEAQLQVIERRIVSGMVASFGLEVSGLVLDMTNFATYIDSGNSRAPIAPRGHAKQKRTDLLTELAGAFPLVRGSWLLARWVRVLAHAHYQGRGAQASRHAERAAGGIVGLDRRPVRALSAA